MGNKKGKIKGGTWIERELFMSRAYHALSGFAPQLLIMFLGKRDMRKKSGKYVCINQDSITMTYTELENIYNRGKYEKHLPKGITRTRINAALKQLLTKGFIKIIHRGGGFQQDKTIYALTDDWCLWRPRQVIYERPKDTRKLGYRKPKK
jgi:hypothetical protein